MNELAEEIISLLRERNETIATAESITGGDLSSALTSIPGASHAFKGGFVAYSAASKVAELGVSEEQIAEHTVYSEVVALAMAQGAKNRLATDWAIATTGVAGPGDSHGIAPGSVWIAIIGPDIRDSIALKLAGDREEVRSGAVSSALATFARILGGSR